VKLLKFAAALSVLALILSACSEDKGKDKTSRRSDKKAEKSDQEEGSGSGKARTLPDGGAWLAVLGVADDPNLFDNETKDLIKPAGRLLVVAPATCFDGLESQMEIPGEEGGGPSDTSQGVYVLGLLSDDRKAINKVLRKTGSEAEVVAAVVDTCLGS
jgi:hypothetical protein